MKTLNWRFLKSFTTVGVREKLEFEVFKVIIQWALEESVMGLLFLFRWCVYGKFTCVPKYKPGISKLDYTNSSFCQISSSSRYFSPRFKLMELTVPSVELFAQSWNWRWFLFPKLRMKVNQSINFTLPIGVGRQRKIFRQIADIS